MMDFTVEYLPTRYASPKPCAPDDVAFVRLAEVEKLVQEAEWAMEFVRTNQGRSLFYDNEHRLADYKRAQAFLASVAAWRTGQEGNNGRG